MSGPTITAWAAAPADPESDDAVLMRLATLPPPSAHSLVFNNRRDVVREQELDMQVHAVSIQLRREIATRIAWLARRLRRELGAVL